MIAKLELTQSNTHKKQRPTKKSMEGKKQKNEQQQNVRLRTDDSLSHRGLNEFFWRQIIPPDSVVVKALKLLGLGEGILTNAMHNHRETI